MTKIRNFILLIAFVFSSLLLQFCRKCGGEAEVITKWVEQYSFSDIFKNKTTRMAIPRDSVEMTDKDSLFFEIDAKISTTFRQSGYGGYLTACDKRLAYQKKDADSLGIICLEDFDSRHPAGTDVSEFFRIADLSDTLGFFPVKSFNAFRAGQLFSNYYFHLALLKKPETNRLKIKLFFYTKLLNDGTTAVSPVVTFKH